MKTFADDTGRVLYDPEDFFVPFSMFDRVLDDGKVLVVELSGSEFPAATARALDAEGTLVVRQAHAQETLTGEPVELVKGIETRVGSITLEIVGVEKSSWNDTYEIEVKTSADLPSIVEWVWVDASGERIELERMSTLTFNGTSQLGLATPKLVSEGHFEIRAWKDAKSVRIPFDTTVRIGTE